jgi:LPS-assembly lipoprotein
MRTFSEASVRSVWLGKILGFVVLTGVLCACGFHLRGAAKLPAGMERIYAQGFAPGSQFLPYLAQDLKHADGALAARREDAGVILNAINEQFLRREVSLSETGKANMYQLSYLLTYDLQNQAGEVILSPQTITVVREYFNPQVEVIGKFEEEGLIRKEMYREAVRNLLRSLEVATRGQAVAR